MKPRTTSACSGFNPSADLSTPSCIPWHATSSPRPRVRPAVVRADDRAHVPGVLAAELRAAMAADVVERAHGAVVVAHHQHRRRVDRQREEVARIRNLEREAGEQPAAVPDPAASPPRTARRSGRTRAACRGRRAACRGARRGRSRARCGVRTCRAPGDRDARAQPRIALRSGSYSGRVWRTAG